MTLTWLVPGARVVPAAQDSSRLLYLGSTRGGIMTTVILVVLLVVYVVAMVLAYRVRPAPE